MNISYNNSTVDPVDEQLQRDSTVVVVVMQFVNFFMGIPLNIYIIFLLTRAGGLDESVFFAVSQSVSEIFFALSTPSYLLCVVAFCLAPLLKFFTGTGMVARLMFQCLVCVERYLAVVHPVTFLKFKPLKYRLFCLIVSWIYVLTCSITFMFVSEFELFNFFGSHNLVIVIVEIFCCVSILKVLKKPAPGKREDSKINSTKKKAFNIVGISLLTHLIQLVPLVVLYSIRNAVSSATMTRAKPINMAVNIAVGLTPPMFFLHRAGKLTITRSLAKTTNRSNHGIPSSDT